MANINLRGTLASGTTLTFAQVDDNFTNLNNESFYGGITFNGGTLSFTPIGHAGDSNAYPDVTLNLDDRYVDILSDLSQKNIIKNIYDSEEDVLRSSDSGWSVFNSKIHVDNSASLAINSNFYTPDIDLSDYLPTTPLKVPITDSTFNRNLHWRNRVQTTDYPDVAFSNNADTIIISDLSKWDKITGTDTDSYTQRGSSLTPYYVAFAASMINLDQDLVGTRVDVNGWEGYPSGHRRGTISSISISTVTEDSNVVVDEVEIDVNWDTSEDVGDPSSVSANDYIEQIKFHGLLKSPRTPIVAPREGSIGIWQETSFARLLAPNHSLAADHSDLTFRYADQDNLLCSGLTSQSDIEIAPLSSFGGDSVSTQGVNGAQWESDPGVSPDDLIRTSSYTLNGGDVFIGGGDHTQGNSSKGGDIVLRSGLRKGTGEGGLQNDHNHIARNAPANLTDNTSARTEISIMGYSMYDDTVIRSPNGQGRLSSPSNGQKEIHDHVGIRLFAGTNYSATNNDTNQRDGRDIVIMPGGGVNSGTPGSLRVVLSGVPYTNRLVEGQNSYDSNLQDTQELNETVVPISIDWETDGTRGDYFFDGYGNGGHSGYNINLGFSTDYTKLNIGSRITQMNDSTMVQEPSTFAYSRVMSDRSTWFNTDGFLYQRSNANQDDIDVFNGFASGTTGITDNVLRNMAYYLSDKDNYQDSVGYEGYVSDSNPFNTDFIFNTILSYAGSTVDVERSFAGEERMGGDSFFFGNVRKNVQDQISDTDGDYTTENNYLGCGVLVDGSELNLFSNPIQNNSGLTKVNVKAESVDIDGATDIAGDLTVTGQITATGDITAFSDESIKENVEVIEDAVDKVQQLNGYTFDRTDIETSRQTGVIAQEVLKVLPEAVGESDGKHTVANGNMVGLLIEAIKEQQGQIDSLKEELQSIKSINK